MTIILYYLSAYLIGSLMAGYFVVKLLGRKDIRVEGSRNVGARNAGRVHGKASFVLTFLGDALKGAMVIYTGQYLDLVPELVLAGLFFAILGHVKPITLGFKGGMGISTFIGGMLAFEPMAAIVIIAGFLLLYPLLKSFTFAGLGAFITIPFFLYFRGESALNCILAGILVLVILYIHREDIMERLGNKTKK
ncbi:glycerol-3-phosphate acyltransferase [Mesobacillus subterraneus]|uniref:Glycerol-3-phosphate acyltransferase n=1 Tax=Mesobacillus subterraneus TaxID=285983 RepID=A0A427TMB1_9BACI|nr:glycerol-3-phosphate acyltransferase [Mesobacillus subterraneus]RSD25478.1 glycerol-3-phosphate acyltransferase [Mesobacillus subterraneus]